MIVAPVKLSGTQVGPELHILAGSVCSPGGDSSWPGLCQALRGPWPVEQRSHQHTGDDEGRGGGPSSCGTSLPAAPRPGVKAQDGDTDQGVVASMMPGELSPIPILQWKLCHRGSLKMSESGILNIISGGIQMVSSLIQMALEPKGPLAPSLLVDGRGFLHIEGPPGFSELRRHGGMS